MSGTVPGILFINYLTEEREIRKGKSMHRSLKKVEEIKAEGKQNKSEHTQRGLLLRIYGENILFCLLQGYVIAIVSL